MIFLLLFLAYTTCVSCSPSPNQLHAQVHPRETTNSSPFKLKVHSANANANANANPEHELNDRLLHVCNLQFWTGEDAKTCTYCFEAPPQFVCSRYGNQTVLLASGAMVFFSPLSFFLFLCLSFYLSFSLSLSLSLSLSTFPVPSLFSISLV